MDLEAETTNITNNNDTNNSMVVGDVVTDGVVTDGVVTDGVVTDGVVTDGVVTDGVVTDGVVTDGGVTGEKLDKVKSQTPPQTPPTQTIAVSTIFETHKDKLLQMYVTERTNKGLGLMIIDISEDTAKVGYNLFSNLPLPVQEDLVKRAEKHPVPESIAFFLFINKGEESLVEYDLNEILDNSDDEGKSGVGHDSSSVSSVSSVSSDSDSCSISTIEIDSDYDSDIGGNNN